MTQHVVHKVENDIWIKAQEFELNFAKHAIASGDDWNRWWLEKFENYDLLAGKTFTNVLEVGCGPHTNIRHILPKINCKKVYLEDPLIQFYCTHLLLSKKTILASILHKLRGKPYEINYLLNLFANLRVSVDLSAQKLEDLPYRDETMDLLVCINVLDHVNDYDGCMSEIYRVLRPGGVLVLGQDLSNDEDLQNCPESYEDIGHPIKVDHLIIDATLNGNYDLRFRKLLPKEEGRNPAAHYSTYLGIAEKHSII